MTYNPAMASVKYQRSQEALERALDELKKSENNLRQAIDTIPTLAWSLLPDGLSARAILGHITPRERGAAAEEN